MLKLDSNAKTFHTLLLSKLWYHLLTIELYRGNLSHKFIQYIAELTEPLYIFHFSLRVTYISDPKRGYICN